MAAKIAVEITLADLDTLISISHYYEKSFGRFRHVVRLTSGREMRARYRFMYEESGWLDKFARSTRERAETQLDELVAVSFTPVALVAFWGRLLASLNSRHSRRKISAEEIQARGELARKLGSAATAMLSPAELEELLATRRPIEASWMRTELGLPAQSV
jgi:hypothetical protein